MNRDIAAGQPSFQDPGERARLLFTGAEPANATTAPAFRAGRALRSSEQRYRQLLHSLPAAVYTCDAEGRILLYNQAAVELWGREPRVGEDRWCGSYRIQRPDGSELPLDECPMAVALREARSVRGEEIVIERPDGTRVNVLPYPEPIFDARGKLAGGVNMLVEITAIKQAQADLAATRDDLALQVARLGRMIETAQLAVVFVRPDGRILSCNRAFLDLVGRSADDVRAGRLDWTLLTPPEFAESTAETLAALASENGAPPREAQIFGSEGRRVDVLVSGTTLPGEPHEHVLFVVDLTAQKRTQAALRLARAEAERANRIKDDFVATLSHELRTPINAILGWTAILKRGNTTPEETAEAVNVIERNARLQAQLISDLMDVSRIVAGKLRLDVKAVDIVPVVESAVESVILVAETRGVQLASVVDPAAGIVMGDPNRLQQIVWNLLSNAIKFTPTGGRITLELQRVGPNVEISVADTGIGIEPSFLPRIFDRFSQAGMATTRNTTGLGIGLAIAKQLCELQGGTLQARSAGLGKGATFVVTLPVSTAPLPSMETTPSDADLMEEPVRLTGVRVLLVDDEPDAREFVRRLLGEHDARVTVAGSADEGLAALEKGSYDVLVSDIRMPTEDGYSLIRRVRARPPDRGGQVPAVALTAFARSEDRTRALMSGFQAHVPKPVEADELLATVASLLRRIST